jgi:thiol-disulfide isomerase/thioredoxin
MSTPNDLTPSRNENAFPTGQPRLPTLNQAKKKKSYLGWFVVIVIAVVAILQWPTLKDVFFEMAGIPFPESTIPWRHDFDAALSEAKQTNKPVLVVFGAGWCPPCRTMKREVWPDEKITEVVEAGFVPVYIDVDEPTQAGISVRYKVRGIPAVLVLNSDGDVVRKGNSMSQMETLQFLKLSGG